MQVSIKILPSNIHACKLPARCAADSTGTFWEQLKNVLHVIFSTFPTLLETHSQRNVSLEGEFRLSSPQDIDIPLFLAKYKSVASELMYFSAVQVSCIPYYIRLFYLSFVYSVQLFMLLNVSCSETYFNGTTAAVPFSNQENQSTRGWVCTLDSRVLLFSHHSSPFSFLLHGSGSRESDWELSILGNSWLSWQPLSCTITGEVKPVVKLLPYHHCFFSLQCIILNYNWQVFAAFYYAKGHFLHQVRQRKFSHSKPWLQIFSFLSPLPSIGLKRNWRTMWPFNACCCFYVI